ncbi:MAG: hypothetical protein JXR95_16475 [Deltaproteobacteria bacterium]|nr:hypothetical protein [Deltaproteobacteria bacterium]
MKKLIIVFLLVSGSFSIGCDDGEPGDGYNGLYHITLNQSRDQCGEGEWFDITPDYDYFFLEAANLFGTPIIGWSECTDDSKDTCDDYMNLELSFVKEDGVWMQQTMWSSQDINGCRLMIKEGLLANTDDGISISTTTIEGIVTLEEGDDCHYELIDKYFDQMSCTEELYLEAEKL